MHVANNTEEEQWIEAGNLGSVLQVHLVRSVSIPVRVNLMFIGFEKDGNNGEEVNFMLTVCLN